jgi:hypothetical protein
MLWNQGLHDRLGIWAKLSAAIDPGGAYSRLAHYPAEERITPHTLVSMAVQEIRTGADRLKVQDHYHPLVVDQAKGDHFIYIAEGINDSGWLVHPFFTVQYRTEGSALDLCPHGYEVLIALEGKYFEAYGDKAIRDHSLICHQPRPVGAAVIDVADFAAGSIKLDGSNSWVEVNDHIDAFDLKSGEAFSVKTKFKTGNASVQTNARTIFCGGTSPSAALLVIRPDGTLAWGQIGGFGTGQIVVTNAGVNLADSQWHEVEVVRDFADTTSIKIDGVTQSSMTDTTHYALDAVDPKLTIGRRSGGAGNWDGSFRDFIISKPVSE